MEKDGKLTQLSSPDGLSVGKGLTVPPELSDDQNQLSSSGEIIA